MARQTTEWILKLVDNITSPIMSVARKVTALSDIFDDAANHVERLEQRSNILQKSLTNLTIGFAAFAVLAQGSLAFEDGMAKVNTMAELSQKRLNDLTGEVRNLADTIPLARTELEEGLYQAISNDVPKDNWVKFLEDSSKAAVGGLADVGDVVSVTSALIKNYQLDWEQAGEIQDKIQKTAKLGKTSFSELGATLPSVAGSAKTLNVGIDELLGTFGALTGVAGNTSEVATSLNAIFSAMIKPSGEAAKMAKDLGIQFDTFSISKAGGLKAYFDVLTKSVEAYSAKTGIASTQVYATLFGSSEALKAFLPITGAVADDFANKTLQIADSTGTIEKAFEQMSGTSNAELLLMRNRFGNVMDKVTIALKPLFVSITKIISVAFEMFGRFAEGNPVLFRTITILTALTFGVIAVAIGIELLGNNFLLAALKNSAFALSMWNGLNAMLGYIYNFPIMTVYYTAYYTGLGIATIAQWAFNVALSANPIGLVVIGIAALIAIITVAVLYWDEITAAIWKFGSYIVNLVDKIFPGFKEGLKAAFVAVYDFVMGLWNGIKGIFESIGKFLGLVSQTDAEVNVKSNFVDDYDLALMMEQDLKNNKTKDGNGNKNPISNALYDPTKTPIAPSVPTSNGSLAPKISNGISGSGKSITMNLEITNNFNVNGDKSFEQNMDRMIDKVVSKLNDRMRDAVIQFG